MTLPRCANRGILPPTGNPLYAGEQDSDPTAATDCAANSQFRTQVRIAELQAFTQ